MYVPGGLASPSDELIIFTQQLQQQQKTGTEDGSPDTPEDGTENPGGSDAKPEEVEVEKPAEQPQESKSGAQVADDEDDEDDDDEVSALKKKQADELAALKEKNHSKNSEARNLRSKLKSANATIKELEAKLAEADKSVVELDGIKRSALHSKLAQETGMSAEDVLALDSPDKDEKALKEAATRFAKKLGVYPSRANPHSGSDNGGNPSRRGYGGQPLRSVKDL